MGGCIPTEKYIKICSSYFPLFRRKMLHFTREKYIDGVKCIHSLCWDTYVKSWCKTTLQLICICLFINR